MVNGNSDCNKYLTMTNDDDDEGQKPITIAHLYVCWQLTFYWFYYSTFRSKTNKISVLKWSYHLRDLYFRSSYARYTFQSLLHMSKLILSQSIPVKPCGHEQL